jgi:glutamate-1-semialdehyde 2,1-aminomutase
VLNELELERPLPVVERSEALYQRARHLIPGGTQTLAKGPAAYVDGVCPKYLQRGKGCRVWDPDGNEYIDLTMAVGPLVLGYGDPRVDGAIRAQLEDGITFSLMHPLEVEVAEAIRALVPGADRIRFSKTGADVTSAAVRLARAFTRRDRVLACGYHGWHDWTIGTSARAAGVPVAVRGLTHAFQYQDLWALLEELDDKVACVILEPVMFEEPQREFLPALRSACEHVGALLVFDEMWTGFRLALGGAQEHYDVRADLCCFSKAVANGMPLSVLTGRADVMRLLEEDVFFFTTFGGEALSLAAAKATLSVLRDERVPALLAERGKRLKDDLRLLLDRRGLESVRVAGTDPRQMLVFDPSGGDPLEQKSLVQQELLRNGVLWSGFNNLSLAHTGPELDRIVDAYARSFDVLAAAIRAGDLVSRLHGPPLKPLLRPGRER